MGAAFLYDSTTILWSAMEIATHPEVLPLSLACVEVLAIFFKSLFSSVMVIALLPSCLLSQPKGCFVEQPKTLSPGISTLDRYCNGIVFLTL